MISYFKCVAEKFFLSGTIKDIDHKNSYVPNRSQTLNRTSPGENCKNLKCGLQIFGEKFLIEVEPYTYIKTLINKYTQVQQSE